MYVSKSFLKIQDEFNNNCNSHSYMFYTNDFLKCKKDLEILIKYIFKNDNINSLDNDFVVIKKNDKKNILKEDMLDLKNFFQKTSYINSNRIYLIEEAHKLNSTSANMILKFLEEPLNGVIAFFITTNLDSVISTIKSRVQIINVFYDNDIDEQNNDYNILSDLLEKNKYISLFEAKNIFKKHDRNIIINMFNSYINYLYNDILKEENLKMIKKCNKVIVLLNNNVNIDYVLDYLFLEGD